MGLVCPEPSNFSTKSPDPRKAFCLGLTRMVGHPAPQPQVLSSCTHTRRPTSSSEGREKRLLNTETDTPHPVSSSLSWAPSAAQPFLLRDPLSAPSPYLLGQLPPAWLSSILTPSIAAFCQGHSLIHDLVIYKARVPATSHLSTAPIGTFCPSACPGRTIPFVPSCFP